MLCEPHDNICCSDTDSSNLIELTFSGDILEKPNLLIQMDSASSAAWSTKCLTCKDPSNFSMHANSNLK